jgi:rhodanese-related sulfurtransferase
MLMDKGFVVVRPLAGGLDGWADAGYPVEEIVVDRRKRDA